MVNKYKVINESLKVGAWLHETDLISVIKTLKSRNNTLFKKLKKMYEDLEEKKFDEDLLK